MPTKSLKNNVSFYEASGENIKCEFSAVTTESTRLCQL